MSIRLIMLLLVLIIQFQVYAQFSSSEEVQIDSMIMHHIEHALIGVDKSDIIGTLWIYVDGMGTRSIKFSTNNYRLKWDGAKGKYSSQSGKWYIYDKYIVLSHKGQKEPLFVIKKGDKVVMMDDEIIKIVSKLITTFVVNDQWVGYLTKGDVFGFLDGFEKKK